MKQKFILLSAALSFTMISSWGAANSQNDVIMLDLSKSTTHLSFDETNGMWTDTFNDNETEIESQVFSVVHESISDWKTWYGFTASNSINNFYQTPALTYQYSNMARGGILLNDDGTIKTNEAHAPVTGQSMPYLVCFAGFSNPEITFNTGKSYEMVGVYVNLNSYTYYTLLYGDGFARSFTEGDKLTLTVHGVDADENEKTVEVNLASFSNGFLSASTGWQYVDLSSLGVVKEIYFTMNSTDTGAYGMNTPAYFCLDKLAVKEATSSVIKSEKLTTQAIYYNRENKTIMLTDNRFAMIYNASGHVVMTSSDINQISVESLPAGVYIVKAGNKHLIFAR